MRKFLLASAAILGVTGAANAQVTLNAAPTPAAGGAAPFANTAPAPAPGQIVVRLNGAFLWYAGFTGDGDGNISYYTSSATAPTSVTKFATTANNIQVAAKTNQGVSFISYIRLYPGFDGVAANGLKYGVAAEIRQDVAAVGAGTSNGISGNNPARSALYWRRAYGYIGGDNWGTIRVGSGDGPSNLLSSGKMYVNGGGWNGDDPSLRVGGVGPSWPFFDVGSLYITNKVVYLSPQFYGFDAGVSWEPNQNALSQINGCGSLGLAAVGCDRLSTITTSSGNSNQQSRRENTMEAFMRYRGTFGGVGISAFGGYIGSGHVGTNNTPSGWGPTNVQYNGLSLGLGGGQITYAGFSVGGLIQSGNYNRGWALKPDGAPNATAWLAGWTYTTGPVIFGASYWQMKSAGAYIPRSNTSSGGNDAGNTQTERGFQTGATYSVAPGMAIYLSYLWGDRQQDGVNLLTGEIRGTSTDSCSTNNNPAGACGGRRGSSFNNRTTAQIVSIGTVFKW